MHGICNLSIIPLRALPDHKSEMVSQLLFGEYFSIQERFESWIKITLASDSYEGWIDQKQMTEISQEEFQLFQKSEKTSSQEIFSKITFENSILFIPMGSNLPYYNNGKFTIGNKIFNIHAGIEKQKFDKKKFIDKVFLFLETPYLWGGKSVFGIDCSGFSQLIMAQFGIYLLRDAHQQANQGQLVSFISEMKIGDLAFFDNNDGQIIHVGIILDNFQIIHAHGKVRIDSLDDMGIFNKKTGKHSHRLRFIKRYF